LARKQKAVEKRKNEKLQEEGTTGITSHQDTWHKKIDRGGKSLRGNHTSP